MLHQGMLINDRYEIIEKIGSGGMSVVYKAKCTKLERNVAIKVLREEYCSDDEFVNRFKVEAQAAASLSHSNIVNIYDVGNEKKIYFIVMELLEGKTLKEYIKEKGKLSDIETMKIGACIASALEHAHENHIIHRDIKPQNIIITADGKVKVADFGIAKVATEATIASTDIATGSVHYIAPEQARGGYCDEKSDIYSLGITMYEMITGDLPFKADTAVSVALKQIHDKLPSISEKVPDINKGLVQIIQKATEKKPEVRYETAMDLLSDLKMAQNFPNEEFSHINKFEDDSPTIVMTQSEMSNIWDKSDNLDKEEEKEKGNKAIEKGVTALGVVAAVCLVAVIAFFTFKNYGDKLFTVDVTIPTVEGKSLDEAKDLLKGNKLKYEVIGEEYSLKYAKGFVIKQTPEAENTIKSGNVIELMISKGKEMVKVPEVTNINYLEAEKKIVDLGLLPKRESENSDTASIGTVIRQEPNVGEDIAKGDELKIYVSIGKKVKYIRVPNIRGKKLDEAKSILTGKGITVGHVSEVYHDVVPKGYVVNMTTEPGREVKEGYEIDLAVSKGKEIKEVTRTITLNNLLSYGNVQGMVKVVLTTGKGETIIFNKLVTADNFPLIIPCTGYGKATVDVYLDEVKQYTKEIDFSAGVDE
jgi:serine/threonine-protein kinase